MVVLLAAIPMMLFLRNYLGKQKTNSTVSGVLNCEVVSWAPNNVGFF
jgi:hypothetical protein